MEGGPGDSIVLEEEIDPNYEPTEKEVIEYATWLGMDLEAEKELFWIAREGLKAPLPENWKPCKTTDTEEIYYFNFATGQSTWDHPCDEFYRNLYEENKKKHTGGGQDMDEKKRKEKEDVAELLGRGKSGKKKKAAAKADALGGIGGGPTLSKTGSLEMKPLSKLGSLGPVGGGSGPGGLKPVGSLGRMRGSGAGGKSIARDEDEDDVADAIEVPKTLSKPPLGGLLAKKALPATPSSSLLASSSLSRGAEIKVELDGLSSELEGKKAALMEQHAKALRDLESEHEGEVAALKSKLQQRLEAAREEEEDQLKQLKRDLAKKTNDLENQFDRDENALLRQRKDKLKKLEADVESALVLKRQELDRDHRADADKMQARHDARLREMKDEFASDERKLGDKLQAELGEKTEALAAATKLKVEVNRLTSARESLEQQLRTCRLENEQLASDKRVSEQKIEQAGQTIKDLRRQVVEAQAAAAERQDLLNDGGGGGGGGSGSGTRGEAVKSGGAECSRCPELQAQADKWRKEAEEAQRECAACRTEVEKLRVKLTSTTDGFASREQSLLREHTVSAGSKEEEIRSLRDVESALRLEAEAASEREAALKASIRRLEEAARVRRDASDRLSSPPTRSEQDAEAVEELRRQLEEEVNALKGERSDLQDELAVLAATSAQVKEQLLKESKEKKLLREQLDGAEATLSDLRTGASQPQGESDASGDELRRRLEQQAQEHIRREAELQSRLEASEQARETAGEALRTQVLTLESDKRAALAEAERLGSDSWRLEAEKAAAVAQLQAARAEQAARQSEGLEGEARALEAKTRELDALAVSFRGVSAEKERLETRAAQLAGESEALQAQVQRLELACELERGRSARTEADKGALALRLREAEDEVEAQAQRARAMASEAGELKAQLGRSRVKEQGSADRLQQLAGERSALEQALQTQQRELEAAAKDLRAKSGELEDQQAQVRELRADGEVLQEQVAALQASVLELRTRLQAASASGGAAGGAAERTEAAVVREQVTALEAKLDALGREKAQLADKLRALTQRSLEGEAAARTAAAEKEQAVEGLEAATAELAKWRAKAERAVKDGEVLAATTRELEADKEVLEASGRRLADQVGELSQAKLTADKTRKALESEICALEAATEEAEAARRAAASEHQALQGKARRLEGELAAATRQVQALQEVNADLETKAAQQTQELAVLQAKLRLLRSENAELSAGAKESEVDVSRNGAAARQLEEQLANKHFQLQRERDEREALASQLQALLTVREELEAAATALRRRAEAAESKWKEHEEGAVRDELVGKRRLQQLELERDALARGKDRAETQLKAVEKELSGRTEALDGARTELESLQTRLKSVLKEHEEVRAMLLTASLASSSAGAESQRQQQQSTSSTGVSADAMLVKLQLADVNRSELETHLADVAAQLETANRRCALLDTRCRDRAMDVEALHVEVASLRGAAQQMHLSALETLSLVERLEYEHKKRVLKADFTDQLRAFQEREDAALARRKARMRAQFERQLDELGAEMETRRQRRVEQEEAAAQQLLDHLRRERDARREELQLQMRKELQAFERELLERKDREMGVISKAIEQEEAQLAFRLREARQTAREEELARQAVNGQLPSGAQAPAPFRGFSNEQVTSKAPQVSSEPAELAWSCPDDEGTGRKSKHRARHAAKPRRSPSKRASRATGRSKQAAKVYRQWKQRVEREHALLAQAKTLLARQRQELSASARQLRKSASEWRRGSHGARDNQIQQQMKEMLDESTADWNERKAKLAEREDWVKGRERKLSRMEHAVEKLHPATQGSRRRSNNHTRETYDDSDSVGSSGSDDASDAAEDSSESEGGGLGDVLTKLQQLDGELASDSSDWSERALVGTAPSEWNNGISTRGVSSAYCPITYSPRYQAPDTGLAGNSYRNALAPFSTGIGLRRKTPATVLHSPVPTAAASTSRWLFSGPRSTFSSQRAAGVAPRPMTSNERRLSERTTVYQRQISQWARDREKVHHAASKHASWLSGLCEELKEYSASRHGRVSDGEGAAASPE